MYYYLYINFSDVINECRRLYPDNDFVFVQDSAPSHRAKATQNFLRDKWHDVDDQTVRKAILQWKRRLANVAKQNSSSSSNFL